VKIPDHYVILNNLSQYNTFHVSRWSGMCLKLSELNPPVAERMQAATAADTRSAPSEHNARASRF